uniref:Uncharacterized protein n=1 Tax=Arundo donax TaxID=35708 RepID=A0A0A9H7Y3_ARUDO
MPRSPGSSRRRLLPVPLPSGSPAPLPS